MIKYYDGTIFNTKASAIVNTVNCTGVMGAGIALEFMLRYPDMFKDYKERCENGEYLPGRVNYYLDKDVTIVNFSTKWHFKYPSRIEWIENGLRDFCKTYKDKGITSVAFPKLGTNNGGLDWQSVKVLMEKYLGELDIDVYICLDSLNYAEGIEKEMLDRFNAMSIDNLSNVVKLNINQKEALEKNMPYNRFWKISTTDKIGIKTYEKLFKHFYSKAITNDFDYEQMSIMDMVNK